MHGLGFMSINEWGAGLAGILAAGYSCLMLRDGKVAIIGMRCDPGIDTESGYPSLCCIRDRAEIRRHRHTGKALG